jgi:small subunit ribosomal protein S6
MAKPNKPGSKHPYEICVILDADLDEKKSAQLLDKYLEIVTNDEGSVDKIESLGRKTFEYEIKKRTEGIYLVANFTCASITTDEFVRRLGLDESVLRYKVFRG